jgi:predicted CoA-binding protein
MLVEKGHSVIAIGQNQGEVAGISIKTKNIPLANIDTVTLYLSPKNQESIMQQILFINPRRIIFNPGTENPEFIQKATDLGIETIEACTLVMLRTNQY